MAVEGVLERIQGYFGWIVDPLEWQVNIPVTRPATNWNGDSDIMMTKPRKYKGTSLKKVWSGQNQE